MEEERYATFSFNVKSKSGEEKPIFVIIKDSIRVNPPRKKYPYAVFIDVYTQKDEYPIDEEAVAFEILEDELIDRLEDKDSIFIGHVTKPKRREIIFYTCSPHKVEKLLYSWKTNSKFNADIEVQLDKKWENIEAFLAK